METVQLSCCVNHLESTASEKYERRSTKTGPVTNIWVGEAAESLIEQISLRICWFLGEPTSSWSPPNPPRLLLSPQPLLVPLVYWLTGGGGSC